MKGSEKTLNLGRDQGWEKFGKVCITSKQNPCFAALPLTTGTLLCFVRNLVKGFCKPFPGYHISPTMFPSLNKGNNWIHHRLKYSGTQKLII